MQHVNGTRVFGALAVTTMIAIGTAGRAQAQTPQSCGDVLIVLDRSTSMALCQIDGRTKHEIAVQAIQTVIQGYPAVPFGLMVFPGVQSGSALSNCSAGQVVVDIGAGGGAQIVDYLSTHQSSGRTPTGSTMEAVTRYTGWTTAPLHYVILITDGQPTCDDGLDPNPACATPNGADVACTITQTVCECRNPTRVFDAIAALGARTPPVRTFVVGFEGQGSGTGCTTAGSTLPYNPDTLNRAAELGGVPNTDGSNKYYAATDATSLQTLLGNIVGQVIGSGDPEFPGTAACRIDEHGNVIIGGATGSDGGGASGAGGTAGSGGNGTGGRTASDGGRASATEGGGCGCAAAGPEGAAAAGGVLLFVVAGIAHRRRRRS